MATITIVTSITTELQSKTIRIMLRPLIMSTITTSTMLLATTTTTNPIKGLGTSSGNQTRNSKQLKIS